MEPENAALIERGLVLPDAELVVVTSVHLECLRDFLWGL
jgi:hypothetical protein